MAFWIKVEYLYFNHMLIIWFEICCGGRQSWNKSWWNDSCFHVHALQMPDSFSLCKSLPPWVDSVAPQNKNDSFSDTFVPLFLVPDKGWRHREWGQFWGRPVIRSACQLTGHAHQQLDGQLWEAVLRLHPDHEPGLKRELRCRCVAAL